MVQGNSFKSFDTINSACSVEFAQSQPIIAIGTYQVTQESDSYSRSGSIILIDEELNLLQTLETAAILDMKWRDNLLATTDSTGFVNIYSLIESNLEHIEAIQTTDSIVLSTDWSSNSNILSTHSDGSIQISQPSPTGYLPKTTIKAHNLETWTGAFQDPNTILTGSDDGLLKQWDTRTSTSSLISKSHMAGVTSITTLENTFYTGSYDDHLRLWDLRSSRHPILEFNTTGGVWRIRPDPNDPKQLLLACMYSGFKVVRVEEEIRLVKEYDVHKSIAYGADWSRVSNKIGTCSFYDHLFTLWSLE